MNLSKSLIGSSGEFEWKQSKWFMTFPVFIIAIVMSCIIVFTGIVCRLARQEKVLVLVDREDPVLSFAIEELTSMLNKERDLTVINRSESDTKADWKIHLIVDEAMMPYSFSVKCVVNKENNWTDIQLKGPDPTCVLHAVYTMLERTGICFDFIGPIMPKKIKMENLVGFSTLIQPAVNQRGIRLHINFAMDISSYPLDEAKEYVRNLSRMRMNYLTLHSYPGQWYAFKLKFAATH